MYQVKILKADQIDILEDSINSWMKKHQEVEVVDMKFHSNASTNETNEYISVLIYQQ